MLRSPHDGDVTSWPLRDRSQLLDQIPYSDTLVRMPTGRTARNCSRSRCGSAAEGVVAKRWCSRYRPGRSSAWLKFKRSDRVTCVATAWVDGGEEPSRAVIVDTEAAC